MFRNVSPMSTPKECQGCNNVPRQPSSVQQRVEVATGVRVWSKTNYTDGRLPVMEDAFRGKLPESVIAVAVREHAEDSERFNRELSTCPGIQEGQICGRLAVNATNEAAG